MTVSIIIVTWNAKNLLQRFLPDVVTFSHTDCEIIIADNNSDDGSSEWIQNAYPEISICKLDNNYGYCGGNNRAAKTAKGDILIFLNNDVEVKDGWISPILSMFVNEPETAVIQPKVLSLESPAMFEYAGAAGGWLDRFAYPFCRGRIFDSIETDQGQYSQPATIFWASGAAFCIRRSVFETWGGFDEDFEFHMEEIDLCWRIQNAGYTIRYHPESSVYHLGGGSLAANSPRKTYYNFRNNLVMIAKNASGGYAVKTICVRFFLDIIAGLRFLMQLKGAHAASIFRAWYYFLRTIKNTLSKRKQIANKINPVHMHGFWNKSILWAYYFERKRRFTQL